MKDKEKDILDVQLEDVRKILRLGVLFLAGEVAEMSKRLDNLHYYLKIFADTEKQK